jgi:small multidrug resistance pump
MASARRPPRIAWVYLYVAIAIDVVGVFLLAGADGFRQPLYVGIAVAAFAVEFCVFALALKCLEASVAYALYGVGTATVAVISIVGLGESVSPLKVTALATIVVGAILLNSVGAKTGAHPGCAPADAVADQPGTPTPNRVETGPTRRRGHRGCARPERGHRSLSKSGVERGERVRCDS